jgi:hypothetical protein
MTYSSSENLLFCEFSDSEGFIEHYDLNADPHQLNNTAKILNIDITMKLRWRLVNLVQCSGSTCRNTNALPFGGVRFPCYFRAR